MIDERSIPDIRQAHPMPWQVRMTPQPGRVTIVDAMGVMVPLPAMLKVLHIVTHHWAAEKASGQQGGQA
jgi:hypothetical protein